MTTHNVSTASELSEALGNAVGGDTIMLADGSYGAWKPTQNYTSMVTLRAVNPLGAIFSGIQFDGASNIRLERIHCGSLIFLNFTVNHHIDFVDGKMTGLYTQGSGTHSHINIQRNVIGPRVGNDLCQILGSTSFMLIESNEFRGVEISTAGAHPDMLQMFARADTGVAPSDIIIRKNLWWDDPSRGSIQPQGIFLGGPEGSGYRRIVIEENLIMGAPFHSLFIGGGVEGCRLNNNTIMGGALNINASSPNGNAGTEVAGNVTTGLSGAAGSNMHDNLTMTAAERAEWFPAYVNGRTWEQYVPAAGSPAATKGAFAYIAELQGNPPPEPEPEPTPEPEPDPMADYLTITAARIVSGPATIAIVGTPGQPDHDVEITPTDPDYVGDVVYEYDYVDQEGFAGTQGNNTVTYSGTPPVTQPDNTNAAKGETHRPNVLGNDVA